MAEIPLPGFNGFARHEPPELKPSPSDKAYGRLMIRRSLRVMGLTILAIAGLMAAQKTDAASWIGAVGLTLTLTFFFHGFAYLRPR